MLIRAVHLDRPFTSHNNNYVPAGFAHKVGTVPGIEWFADGSTQHIVYGTDFMGKAATHIIRIIRRCEYDKNYLLMLL